MGRFLFVNALAAAVISSANGLVSKNQINSQIRVAYAGPTGMTVSWNTFEQVQFPTVIYGLTPFTMFHVATSHTSVTYNTSLTYNNHVKLTNLRPDTTYYYLPTCLIKTNEPRGPYSFKTSKLAGDNDPYSIAIVVDMGNMGPEGLYTSAGKGISPNNILAPGEINTVQSLSSAADQYEFLWHRKSSNFQSCDKC